MHASKTSGHRIPAPAVTARTLPFSARPGWAAAVALAADLYPATPACAFAELGAWSGGPSGILPSAAMVGRMATTWWETASDLDRARVRRAYPEAR
jgi:hypothetical protein